MPQHPLPKGLWMLPRHAQLLEEARRLDRAGDHPAALAVYEQFLALEPNHADAWADYAGLLIDMTQFEEARTACTRALECDPGHLAAMINLASASQNLNEAETALAWYERVLSHDPKRIEALIGLGNLYSMQGDFAKGQNALERAIANAPDNLQARKFLVQNFIKMANWPSASAAWNDLVDLGYSGAEAQWERATLNLLFGRLPEAWTLYESRFDVPEPPKPERAFSHPRWQGEPFPGKTLLLHWEQGFGDTVMFVRYAAMVKALGGRVILEVQRPLAALMGTCTGLDAVIPYGDPLPPFDLQLPLLSLPFVFQTSLKTIPASIPYLDIPEQVPNREALRQRLTLGATEGRVRVGLAWSGSTLNKHDAERSISPHVLEPLSGLSNIQWFSLQREDPGAVPFPGMIPLGDLLGDFSDTAYALSGLDLLVTVDTAVAHLAGAMGIPVLMLVAFIPDWRWMLEREDSPWYPSLRIYRQRQPKDWPDVIAKLAADLS